MIQLGSTYTEEEQLVLDTGTFTQTSQRETVLGNLLFSRDILLRRFLGDLDFMLEKTFLDRLL